MGGVTDFYQSDLRHAFNAAIGCVFHFLSISYIVFRV